MNLTKEDFAILAQFKFEIQPVGVKYFVRLPEGLRRIGSKMPLCEMLKRGTTEEPFYASLEDHACEAGPYVLGQADVEPQFVSGEFGVGLGVFKDTRAAARLYNYVPTIGKGVVNYVAFSPLDKLSFDPDLMVFLADTTQAWILLRAITYETGKQWASRFSAAIGCSWLLVHPYLTGETNFVTTGLGFGMRRRKLFPEGKQFISVPFDQLRSLLRVLKEMPWMPAPFKPDGLEYVKLLRVRLGLE
jgi:uncharacterized protein (DUF169 family)